MKVSWWHIELCTTLSCYCSFTLVLQCCHRALMTSTPAPLAPPCLGRCEAPDPSCNLRLWMLRDWRTRCSAYYAHTVFLASVWLLISLHIFIELNILALSSHLGNIFTTWSFTPNQNALGRSLALNLDLHVSVS